MGSLTGKKKITPAIPQVVSVQPGVGMLALFPSMNYKPWYAIGEFVDNAIQSWRSTRKELESLHGKDFVLRIEIEFDHERDRILVRDNAAGIHAKDMARAFKPAHPPTDRSGLSQFGIGMKSAACWYARNFEVVTHALGEDVRRTVKFDVPKLIAADQDIVPITTSPAPGTRHGTTVTLSKLYHPIPTGRTLGKLRSYLASIYRDYLRSGSVQILVADELLRYKEPQVLEAPRWDSTDRVPTRWRKDFVVELPSGKKVKGWAALRAKGSTAEAGLALLYRGKVVLGAGAMAGSSDDVYRPETVFGRGNTFMSQRLFGELDVSALRVTYSKDAIVWGGDEEVFLDTLRSVLDDEPLPLLRMAQAHRSTERTKETKDILTAAVNSTAKAMKEALDSDLMWTEPDSEPTVEFDREHAANRPVPGTPAAPAIGANIPTEMHPSLPDLRLEIVDEDFDPRWLRVHTNDGLTTVSVNRAHRFMQSFVHIPGADVEPILRIAAAIALAELKGRACGLSQPAFIRNHLNDLLDGSLAERLV